MYITVWQFDVTRDVNAAPSCRGQQQQVIMQHINVVSLYPHGLCKKLETRRVLRADMYVTDFGVHPQFLSQKNSANTTTNG